MLERDRPRWIAVGALAALAALVVGFVSVELFPYHSINHDEGVYLQQAAMLLEGQLYLRPPVDGAFRPWFFVEDGTRLYSKYSPVPAAVFAVGKLLGDYRLALVAVAAANAALVYGVCAEVFDRRTGVLAGCFLVASPLFVLASATFLPYAPTTALNLVFAWAYLRADRLGSVRWSALAGLGVGLAFFARPYTAVLFAIPFVVHALWTLRHGDPATVRRHAVTATLGVAGVAVALGYNAVVTGAPLRFPYLAFAPQDGVGFGYRRLLGHGVEYTPALATRANALVVSLLLSRWVAGGLLGTALAVVGAWLAIRRGLRPRVAILLGLVGSVVLGNVLFWGNYNLLGDLDRSGDGLVAFLGPYYHFDLLVPLAAFAARGALGVWDRFRPAVDARFDDAVARRVAVAALLISAGTFAAVTAGVAAGPVERSADVTATYEDAYAPFENRSFDDALVYLPRTYGDWLNHPFQALRNDPGFDGDVVYALDGRPFALADAFPDRTLYRYAFRGQWAPADGSPERARLQRVRDVTGARVTLSATLGVPAAAEQVTVRLSTGDDSAYYVATNASESIDVRVVVDSETARLDGEVRPVDGNSLTVEDPDEIRLTAFVDYRAGGGFTYRLDLPTRTSPDGIRALSPVVEVCRAANTCGGAAAYVPGIDPGISVRTTLTAERNA